MSKTITESEQNDCPVCGSEIDLSDGFDGFWYVYCPQCGPIPELETVTELGDGYKLGYPPITDLVASGYAWLCPECRVFHYVRETVKSVQCPESGRIYKVLECLHIGEF